MFRRWSYKEELHTDPLSVVPVVPPVNPVKPRCLNERAGDPRARKKQKTITKDEIIDNLKKELDSRMDDMQGLESQLCCLEAKTEELLTVLLGNINIACVLEDDDMRLPDIVQWHHLQHLCHYFATLKTPVPRDFIFDGNGPGQVEWSMVPKSLRGNEKLTVKAFRHQVARWEDVLAVTNDPQGALIKELLEGGYLEHDLLPGALRDDPDFGSRIASLYPEQVLRRWDHLRGDPAVWERIITNRQQKCWCDIFDLFQLGLAPDLVLSNEDLMKKACSIDHRIVSFATPQLGFGFVSDVVEKNPLALAHVSEEVVERHPEFIILHMKPFVRRSHWNNCDSIRHLADKLGNRLSVPSMLSQAWFRAGLPLIEHRDLLVWKDNESVLLLIARQAPCHNWASGSFRLASDRLLGDKDFMKEAVQINGRLFWNASPELRRSNFELAMLALASEQMKKCAYREFREEKQQLLAKARVSLEEHNAFRMFLRGITVACPNPNAHPLSMLNQTGIKMHIAEFVGVYGESCFEGWPRGRLLRNTRLALEELHEELY